MNNKEEGKVEVNKDAKAVPGQDITFTDNAGYKRAM
jgi:hypothetical protein